MDINNLRVRTKLLGGFFTVILIAVVTFAYIVIQVRVLGDLQNAGYGVAKDAMDLGVIHSRVALVATVEGDAVINGNLPEVKGTWPR